MFPNTHFAKRHPDTMPLGHPRAPHGEAEFVRGWLGHVEAGRIGTPTHMSPQELATQRANEMAVLGHAPSFPDPKPAPLPRRSGRGR